MKKPRAFDELVTASLWALYPDYALAKGHDPARVRRDLIRALDLPRGAMASWPPACAALVVRAQLTVDGQPGGIDKAVIEKAIAARWTARRRASPPVRYDWQNRIDCGDGEPAYLEATA